jgi:predicted DNA-binding transcriptional regulator AlpA
MNPTVLNSWKEIAQYVGRGVRTIQRWERELGFPVRRPRQRERSAVIAIRSEIDVWLRRDVSSSGNGKLRLAAAPNYDHLCSNAQMLVTKTQILRDSSDRLRSQVRRTLALSRQIRARRQTEPMASPPPRP